MDGMLSLSISGRGNAADAVNYDVEHLELEDGEYHMVRVNLDIGFVEASVDFDLDDAEEFLIEFRDHLVNAKRAQLEWESNTDPTTGVEDDIDPVSCDE